jgi:hypothetical protein
MRMPKEERPLMCRRDPDEGSGVILDLADVRFACRCGQELAVRIDWSARRASPRTSFLLGAARSALGGGEDVQRSFSFKADQEGKQSPVSHRNVCCPPVSCDFRPPVRREMYTDIPTQLSLSCLLLLAALWA